MKSRFEPEAEAGSGGAAGRLIDPEAYDASEQEFAASLEENAARPRFVVEGGDETQACDAPAEGPQAELASDCLRRAVTQPDLPPTDLTPADLHGDQETTGWRDEVAARVSHYRARRRPRTPRYPSLLLKFDSPPQASGNSEDTRPAIRSHRQAVVVEAAAPALAVTEAEPAFEYAAHQVSGAETTARLLEFPRSAAAPPRPLEELADPVLEGLRILEVPERLLPPPALGGISIEPGEQPEAGKRRGFELPLQPAPRRLRLLAAFVDAMLVLAAFAAFAAIFFKITSMVPPLQLMLEVSFLFVGVLWATYQYGLLVYCGTTPGLKAAGLRLSDFSGRTVPRKLRRWRAIASILSGAAMALGYAWYFLDEDHLCWHDRVTHTYLAPVRQP